MTLIPQSTAFIRPTTSAPTGPPSTAPATARVGDTTPPLIRPVAAPAATGDAPRARTGADGHDTVVAVRSAMADRQALTREMMEAIPVPPDAVTRLGGDLETLRALAREGHAQGGGGTP